MTANLLTVVVRRLLPAAAEVVYDAWLDPVAVAEFITPAPGRTGRLEWEPRVGGHFLIEMVGAETVTITGEFQELERPQTLRFTWHSSLGGGFDSVVTITLEPRDELFTLMTIEHAQLPSAQAADHEHGWTLIAAQVEAGFGPG